jgi:hypothetical protein
MTMENWDVTNDDEKIEKLNESVCDASCPNKY